MTKTRRIVNIVAGLFMILVAFLLAVDANQTYPTVIFILGITTLISSIQSMVYYISMARHMVGGRTILYRSIIMLDLSLFTLSLTDVPLYCIVLYLAGIHIFAAFVDIMRSIESMRLRAPSWRLSFISGLVNLILGVLCIVFIENVTVAVGIYSLGLAYSGMTRIIQAFRKNKTLYGNAPAV